MDQSTFTKLTGLTLSTSQSDRFSLVAGLCAEQLEEMLGWPLDPNEWDNQYIEIGKSKSEWDCLSADTSDLDPPDEVIGLTRLYTWNPADPYIFIDPAKKINALKIVRNGVTYKTFDADCYSLRLQNAATSFGRYIGVDEWHHDWLLRYWPKPFLVCEHRGDGDYLQLAVDGNWLDDLPTSLTKVWADLIAYELDVKRDIKSESMLSHSYTRDKRADPLSVHASTLAKYVGPRGTALRRGDII